LIVSDVAVQLAGRWMWTVADVALVALGGWLLTVPDPRIRLPGPRASGCFRRPYASSWVHLKNGSAAGEICG